MGSIDPNSKYSQILIRNGIQDEISDVYVSVPKNLVGEHFASICELVRIQFKGGQAQDLYLFAKKCLPIIDLAQKAMFEEVMVKEGFFLTDLVQDMKGYCIDKAGKDAPNIESIFPKTYHADKDAIIMDDLTKQGYVMLPKTEKQHFELAKLVLETLAIFHATSHGLLISNGGKEAFLAKYPLLVDRMVKPEAKALMDSFLSPPFDLILEMLKTSDAPGSQDTFDKLVRYKSNWHSALVEVLATETKLPVVNHGDCWNNNMMFSADKNKVIFVDLQGARVSSASCDIAYYLFSSTEPEVRQQWKKLLKIYFAKFQETAKTLGFSLEITFEDLVVEFRHFAKVGLIFALVIVIGMDAIQVHDTKKSDNFFGNDMENMLKHWATTNQDKVVSTVANVISIVNDYKDVGII